jgi:hypothetical protein
MSWFWRTPSMLARSLMREVAPALPGTNRQMSSAARNAASKVLVITAPQCDGGCPVLCERRANAPTLVKALATLKILNPDRDALCAAARHEMVSAAKTAGAFTAH